MTQRRQHSAAVYRRRRLVAALVGVFVLAVLVWGARGLIDVFAAEEEPAAEEPAEQTPDDDAEAVEPSPDAASETEPEADESDADEDPADDADDEAAGEPKGSCAAGDIEVRASTNQESYGTGVAPLLILEVENIGEEDCTMDVGTAEQTFAVSHSGREIFTTDQCSSTEDSLELELEPGQTESAHLAWPRSDSAADCTEPTELFTGDYELTVSVSGITSEPHSFHLTGVAE